VLREYDDVLSAAILDELETLPGVQIHGMTARARLDERVPAVSFTWEGRHPREIAAAQYTIIRCKRSGDWGMCCRRWCSKPIGFDTRICGMLYCWQHGALSRVVRGKTAVARIP
jgi:selenocysteine lyase/cysteine desulfurase